MLSDLHPPFNRRPPKDAPLRPRKPAAVGPLLPSDRQTELAAHEEASALESLGFAGVEVHRFSHGAYFVECDDGWSFVFGFSDEEGGR